MRDGRVCVVNFTRVAVCSLHKSYNTRVVLHPPLPQVRNQNTMIRDCGPSKPTTKTTAESPCVDEQQSSFSPLSVPTITTTATTTSSQHIECNENISDHELIRSDPAIEHLNAMTANRDKMEKWDFYCGIINAVGHCIWACNIIVPFFYLDLAESLLLAFQVVLTYVTMKVLTAAQDRYQSNVIRRHMQRIFTVITPPSSNLPECGMTSLPMDTPGNEESKPNTDYFRRDLMSKSKSREKGVHRIESYYSANDASILILFGYFVAWPLLYNLMIAVMESRSLGAIVAVEIIIAAAYIRHLNQKVQKAFAEMCHSCENLSRTLCSTSSSEVNKTSGLGV